MEPVLTVKKWKTRIIVKKGNDNLVVRMADVVSISIYGGVVFVFNKEGCRYMADKRLGSIEEQLDPQIFFRINRQAIMNIHFIRSYSAVQKVKLKVELVVPGLPKDLFISQEKASLFRKWMEEEES
jgi:two-component system LytT family response regulator